MNSLFIIADNYIDVYKFVVQEKPCFPLSYHLFYLCRSNNMSVVSPKSYLGVPSESHQAITTDINNLLDLFRDQSSFISPYSSSILFDYLYQIYSSYYYLLSTIPSSHSYQLCICGKVIPFSDLSELVNAILLHRDSVLSSLFTDNSCRKIILLFNSYILNILARLQFVSLSLFSKTKKYFVFRIC